MSTIRYPSGKNLNMQTQMKLQPFVVLLAFIILAYFYKEYALLGACLAYIFFGLVRHWRRPARSSLRSKPPAPPAAE